MPGNFGKQTKARDAEELFIRSTSTPTPSGIVSHHTLLELTTNDDHTQYMHNSNARTVTARHTFNPPTANSPFILGANAIGQKVIGLNADLLDDLDSSSNPGAAANILKTDASGFLNLLRLNVDTLADKSGGNLTLSPTGDLILDPVGNDVLPANVYDINIGSPVKKFLSGNFAELNIGTLVASDIMSSICGRVVVPTGTTVLAADVAATNVTYPTVAASTKNSGSGTAISINKPSGVVNGDIIAIAVSENNNYGITPPADFTWLFSTVNGSSAATGVWYKVVTDASSEPASYSFILATSAAWIAQALLVRGAGVPTVYGGSTGSSANITAASITTTSAYNLLLYVGAIAASADITPPPGMTNVDGVKTASLSQEVARQDIASTGATGSRTGASSASGAWVGQLIAFAPYEYITTKHNQIVLSDILYLESGGSFEAMQAKSAAVGAGPYTYFVTRNLDGTGANAWSAGDAVMNTGATGDGLIDIYSQRGIKSASIIGPTIAGFVRDSATWNAISERWAMGNLNGLYGYGGDTPGVALGEFADGKAWVTIDSTNGMRIMYGATSPVQKAQWDVSGNILLGATTGNHLKIGSSSFEILKAGGVVFADFDGANSRVDIGTPAAIRIDNNGIQVKRGTSVKLKFMGTLGGTSYLELYSAQGASSGNQLGYVMMPAWSGSTLDHHNKLKYGVYGVDPGLDAYWEAYSDGAGTEYLAGIIGSSELMRLLDGSMVINEAGANIDFRVEGDTATHLLFCDASTDRIGIKQASPAYDLDVNGTIRASSYMYESGTYAGIYCADASTAQSIPTGTTYTKMTGFTTNGLASNCTADAANDKITVTHAGKYRVTATINGESGTANVIFRFAAFVDGVEQSHCHCYHKFGTANEADSMAFSGFVTVAANKDIDLRIRHDNGGSINFTPAYMNLNVEYLGE